MNELTIEQKAALYDQEHKQYKVFIEIFDKLFDHLRHGFFNEFNKAFKDKDGNPIETFGVPLSELRSKLHFIKDDDREFAYWLAGLCGILDDMGVEMKEITKNGSPDVHTLVKDNFDCKKMSEAVEDLIAIQKAGCNTVEKFQERYPFDIKKIARDIMIFYFEYKFGHVYPGDENTIYQDAFRSFMIPIIAKAGCLPDHDSMVAFIGSHCKKGQ